MTILDKLIYWKNKKNENNSYENNIHKKMQTIKYEDLQEYQLKGKFDCKIVRVFDGDTLHVVVYKDNSFYRLCCRLLDIDAPEMPRSHIEAMENKKAFESRDRLVHLLTNVRIPDGNFTDTSGVPLPSLSDNDLQSLIDKNTLIIPGGVYLQGTDKYGRYLAYLYTIEGKNVSSILVEENLAIPFFI